MRLPRAELCSIFYKKNGRLVPIENRRAIVGERGQVYAIVSDRYRLVLHEDIYDLVRRVLDNLGIDPIHERVLISKDGALMNLVVCTQDVEVTKNDIVALGFTVLNSYDATSALRFNAGGIRYICSNGIVLPIKNLSTNIRKLIHVKGVIKPSFDEVKETIETITSVLDDIADLLTLATKSTVSKAELVHFIETTFSNVPSLKDRIYTFLKYRLKIDLSKELKKYKESEDVTKLFTESDERYNLWDVYNVFTDVLTHTRKIDLKMTTKLQEKVGEFLIAQVI